MRSAAAAGKPPAAQRVYKQLSAKRVINGTLVLAVGIGSVFVPPAFAALILAISLIGLGELAVLVRRSGGDLCVPVAGAACAAYVIAPYFGLLDRFESLLVGATVVAAIVAALSQGVNGFAYRAGMTVFAALYLGKLLSYFVIVRQGHNGLELAVWLVVIIALTDTVAMMIGMRFGRRPLAPRLSPAKTCEGAFAALLCASAAGAAMSLLPHIAMSPWVGALCGACVCGAAQVGDLAESALKRNAGVKDSGQLIAGHGGVLDRFDSYIVAGAVGYAALRAAGLL